MYVFSFFHPTPVIVSPSVPPPPHVQTERDVSVRQRAADLLYAMCDRSNAKQIVAEMLSYLETADYSIREEMVKYPPVWQPFSCIQLYLKLL